MSVTPRGKSFVSEVVARADRVQRLLEDPDFKAAVEAVRQRLLDRWPATKQEDVEGREQCFRELKALDSVIRDLTETVRTGSFERGKV